MKKILLALGTVTAVVAPIATVVACGDETNTTTEHHHFSDENKGYLFNVDGSRKIVKDASGKIVKDASGADTYSDYIDNNKIIINYGKVTKVDLKMYSYGGADAETRVYTANITLENDSMTVVANSDYEADVFDAKQTVDPLFHTYSVVRIGELQEFLNGYAEYTSTEPVELEQYS